MSGFPKSEDELHAQLSDAHHEGFGAGVAWSDEGRDEAIAAAEVRGYAKAVARLRDDDAFRPWSRNAPSRYDSLPARERYALYLEATKEN